GAPHRVLAGLKNDLVEPALRRLEAPFDPLAGKVPAVPANGVEADLGMVIRLGRRRSPVINRVKGRFRPELGRLSLDLYEMTFDRPAPLGQMVPEVFLISRSRFFLAKRDAADHQGLFYRRKADSVFP